jgi:imidazolonepropionase-like amidohydrolase
MLGITADAGTVEPGKRGDLIVLASDPLADIRAVRTIRWTVKAGVAHTPEEWMQQP